MPKNSTPTQPALNPRFAALSMKSASALLPQAARRLARKPIVLALLSVFPLFTPSVQAADTFSGLGDLAGGGFSSTALGVSGDGSVVVGYSESTSGTEAFRWTQAGGMVGLGDLAGGWFDSHANGVNNDGSVVVGNSNSANGNEAFRWTQAGGMVSVASWLAAAGMSTTGFTVLTDARGVSADGNTVVGYGTSTNGTETFIARVTAASSGIVGLTDLANSLAQTYAIGSQVENLTWLSLNGAHHRTLMDMAMNDGQSCSWVSGDVGRYWRQANGYAGLLEVGACHDVAERSVRVGLGVGSAASNLDLANDGSSHVSGQYGVAEVDWLVPDTTMVASLLGIYGQWNANLSRGYAIAGTLQSQGNTDVTTYSLRARLDWQDAFHLGQAGFTPRLAYTVYRSNVDAYQETGGTAPASFQDQNHTGKELRAGLTGKQAVNEQITLLGYAEYVHRFDSESAAIQGSVNALGVGIGFSQPGNPIKQNWVRLGAEVDYKINERNLISVSSFISSPGEDADMTAAVSWNLLF